MPPDSLPSSGLVKPSCVQRSIGVAVAPFLEGAVAYDAVTDTIHRLGPIASYLLMEDTPTGIDHLIADVATEWSMAPGDVAAHVAAGIDSMRSLGLLDRQEPYWVPDPVRGPRGDRQGRHVGASQVIHDRSVAFCSSDRHLLDEIDAHLGTGVSGRSSDVVFNVEPGPGDRVQLSAVEEWDFSSRENFFGQLIGMLNHFAVRSNTLAVLHAGAVRTPSGEVVAVSGESASGKSTLVAALIQRGCDYLGDEMIGLRSTPTEALPYPKPLELDAGSCKALGIRPESQFCVRPAELRSDVTVLSAAVGPIDRIIIPRYLAGHAAEQVQLDPEDAVKVLLGHTVNLQRVREVGLRAVCELAESVPVTRVTHGDSVALAEKLLAEHGVSTR